MEYRELEGILYNYNTIKSNISNMELELESLDLYCGPPGISYEERISSGGVSNIPESSTIKKMSEEERLMKMINKERKLLAQVNNALDCLNPEERGVIVGKYIEGKQWWQVANVMRYSEVWCRKIRRDAINKMLDTFKHL